MALLEESLKQKTLAATKEDGGDDVLSVVYSDDDDNNNNNNGEDTDYAISTKAQAALQERQTLAREETKKLSRLRYLMLFALFLTALVVGAGVFYFSRLDQINDFETVFDAHATKVIESFHDAIEQQLGAIDTLSVAITSHAITTNSTFPNVTLPNFELKAALARINSGTVWVWYLPLVTDETRKGWEDYATRNQNHILESFVLEDQWRNLQDDNLLLQGSKEDDGDNNNSSDNNNNNRNRQLNIESPGFNSEIWGLQNNGAPEELEGTYFPIWQSSPALPFIQFFNFNAYDYAGLKVIYDETLRTSEAVLGYVTNLEDPEANRNDTVGTFNLFASLGQYRHELSKYLDDPAGPMSYPVFDNFDTINRKVVGMLHVNLYWRLYLQEILPIGEDGVVCVMENSLNQSFTFQINGPEVEFLGRSDLHDTFFNDLEVSQDVSEFVKQRASSTTRSYTTVNLNSDLVQYNIRVYPSKTMRKRFVNALPIVHGIAVVVIFLFTAIVFLMYDWVVEKRQRIVMDKAVKSSAVVSTLFPEQVRDRLLNDDDDDDNGERDNKGNHSNNDNNNNQQQLHQAIRAWRAGANNNNTENNNNDNSVLPSNNKKRKQIADKFECATVLFADLAGFTKWSCTREPEQVFELLETLYGAFDKIAIKRQVFKVETIGDCYLAVTGVPNPQPNHAVIMVKFACDCMIKMKQLTKGLEASLGSDTMDLAFRVGIHSGAVTAGVLRGDRSRFQLFGDTVNTAARMESNGVKNHIQCSQQTADLLIEAGKPHWLTERDGGIEAKGKGRLRTYFVDPITTKQSTIGTRSEVSSDDYNEHSDEEEDGENEQQKFEELDMYNNNGQQNT